MTQGLHFGPRFKQKTVTTPLGRSCPACHIGELVRRKGRFGEFVGCSRFRDGCTFVERDDKSKAENLDRMTDNFLKAHGCGNLVRK